MIKKLFFTLTAMLLASMLTAGPVDSHRAARVAENSIRLISLHNDDGTKAPIAPTDKVVMAPLYPEWNVENLHLFNYQYGDREGFVIVSGDDIAAPVLAFSDEGQMDLCNASPAARYWIERYSQQIAAGREKAMHATPAIARKWAVLEDKEAVEAMLTAKGDFYHDNIRQLLGNMRWNQGDPYNRLCPQKGSKRAVTGCVATAFGMIMNYWDYPVHGFGNHSYNGADNPAAYPNWKYGELSADFENTYYDWAHMDDWAAINSSDSVVEAISTLLYQLGVAFDMNYSPDGSGCWSLKEYAMFDTSLHLQPTVGAEYRIPKHFGYKFSYAGMRDSIGDDTLWMQMLYNSLAEGKPIYYAGWAVENNEAGHSATSGHGFIIDGYFSDEVDSNLFHLNWGWGGADNGLFKIDALTPGGNDFTQWHGAVIGMEPDTSYHGYNPAAIRQLVLSNAIVYSEDGSIVVKSAENAAVIVYDIMGRKVGCRDNHEAADWSLRVRPGIYLVRIGNIAAKKIVVL